MSGIRVFPTDKRDWTLKLSIGNKISQLSNKDHPARKLSIQPAISKRQPTQKWKEGLVNFIAQSKRQILLDARETIKRVEQWQRQTCALMDMVQQHVLHSHDDRHESIAVTNNASEKPPKKTIVNGSSAKLPSRAAKKPPSIAKKSSVRSKKLKNVAKKSVVTAKAAAPKPLAKKPSRAKKSSTSSIKQKAANSSKATANRSANLISNCLPEMTSDSSSEESGENVPIAKEATCPSMPIIQAEEVESDGDNLNTFMKKPIEPTAEAVQKNRHSDVVRIPTSEFAMRKRSMTIHSSKLAIMNKSPFVVVELNPQRQAESDKGTSSNAADKTSSVRKIVEKAPEPIPNFLKSKSAEKDDVLTNFEKLRQRMNEAARKANAIGGALAQATPTQEPSVNE